MADSLVVPERFRGPPSSGNGGWTAGALATRLLGEAPLGRAVRVRLSAPPPLDEPMALRPGADGEVLDLVAGERPVATAQVVDDAVATVPAVPYDVAVAAGERYAGLASHPFPSCFVCGTGRAVGDGLRLQPGPLDPPDDTTACVWHVGPDEADLATVWAAVDCPAGGERTVRTLATLYGEGGATLARAAHIWVVVDPRRFTL